MIDMAIIEQQQNHWLAERILNVKTSHKVKLVSDWASTTRYLPRTVTSKPGMYEYGAFPYLREIADCMSSESPVREIDVIKGAQIGATVGLLENSIGYYAEHEKGVPMLFVSADKELADLRIDNYITPMFEQSGLSHLIKSSDTLSRNKSGKTKDQLSFAGGGFLIPFGANSANKLRSVSMKVLLLDEIDGFKARVGKDGDPIQLAKTRTNGFEYSRKILKLSTPTVKGHSNIEKHHAMGDCRVYKVPCKHCGHKQELKFSGVKEETGELYGLVFETSDGVLIPETVKYLCEECGGAHVEADKVDMLKEKTEDYPEGAEWVPTKIPTEKNRRSYSIPGLLSPYGFKSWTSCVMDWLNAWDIENNKAKDIEELSVFYNNVLGQPFRAHTDKLELNKMWGHRRENYSYGEIPNRIANMSCDGDILLLTCAVDVHGDNLAVAVYGWTEKHRAFLIDYMRIKGDCEDINDQCWKDLEDLIYNKVYQDHQGKKYMIQATGVDTGYYNDTVMDFCSRTDRTVPLKGQPDIVKGAALIEFSTRETRYGITAFNVNVNYYKERWYKSLKRAWAGYGEQRMYCYNLPSDVTKVQLKELTAETRVPDENATGYLKGYKYERRGNNEMWDLLVYNNFVLDFIAWELFRDNDRDQINLVEFWEYCRTGNNGGPVFYEQ
ncbi:terminase large subunit [Vibrio phage 1.175.O._10N.261.55.B3]|nr:terminase large subunit [Vibrio phage 1.175.O._10N.261.55.B3]